VWEIVHAAAEAANDAGAAAGQGAESRTPSFLASPWFMLLAVLALMYFLLFRPRQKQQKERREMLSSLSKGDRVVTSGGICGTIVSLKDKTVVLRVSDDDNIKMEFVRGAISQVASRGEDEENE